MMALRCSPSTTWSISTGSPGSTRSSAQRPGAGRATVRQAAAEHGPELACPARAAALPLIGHFQIRNRGTVGGSIAHADPAAELPGGGAGARRRARRRRAGGAADVPAADFFEGTWTTALAADEVLAAVALPGVVGPARLRRRGGGPPPRRLRHRRRGRRRAARRRRGHAGRPSPCSAWQRRRCGRRPPSRRSSGGRRRRRLAEVGRAAATGSTRPTTSTPPARYRRASSPPSLVAPRAGRAADRGGRSCAEVAVVASPSTASAPSAASSRARRWPTSSARTARLTGTHLGCEHGVCGACTVLLDGEAVRVVPGVRRAGRRRRGHHRRGPRRPTASCSPVQAGVPGRATACSAGSARPASWCR